MSDSTQLLNPQAFDIFMSGYLLTLEMIARLCVLEYNATPAILKDMGPLDTASYYFQFRKVLDAPTLIPILYKDKAQGGKVVERWVLPGKVVFFPPGTPPPLLSYDDETRAYLNTWLPPDLLQTKAFKDIRFITRLYPRGERPTGIILHAIRMRSDRYRESHHKAQQAWVEHNKSLGYSRTKIPPAFPVQWAI